MSRVKESELYFLVLHWLRSGPCQSAADALQRQLEQLSLLPTVPSIGATVRPDYATLCHLFSHVPPSALRELVDECLQLQSDTLGNTSDRALSVLEATGSLSSIPSIRTQLATSTVTIPPPSRSPNFLQRLLQRECAYPRRPLRNVQLIDNLTAHIYEQLQHVKTIRGHRKAVYCVALDGTRTRAITGADDGIIKIWNLKIGLLKTCCRGHMGEITDLKINCDDSLFASCSTDGTSRVWSLREETLGHHIRAMIGHQNGVTFIAFSPVLSCALLSVSLDGTCRLWHAESGIELIRLKPMGHPGHFYNAGAFEKPIEQAMARQTERRFFPDPNDVDVGLTCCAFSSTGEHFAVSSHSGKCFIWKWDVAGYEKPSGFDEVVTDEQTWPDATEVMELAGHEKSVPLLLFNHQGNALCTASSDGRVKVWRPMKDGKRSACSDPQLWRECWSFELPDPLPCPAYNNRRRKAMPECNQIAWSCDDQFVMAAYSCSVIMVWNATTGEEENILYGGHTDSPVHVLQSHPNDPKLCFSAGYDGMLIVWDIVNGRKIKKYILCITSAELSSQDTHPGRWRWADPIQFVDGCFQQDGMGIIVSDVAGQFHLYGLDGPSSVMCRMPYDQFFLYDYDKVIISEKGEPIDMESGEPQHVHRSRFSMVDITEEPYDPLWQVVLAQGKNLTSLPRPMDPPETPSALLILPPTMSAALWLADEMGLGPQATATRVASAQQRQIALMQLEGDFEEVADRLPLMEIDEPPDAPEIEIDDESDGSEYTPDEGDPATNTLGTRRSERIQTRTSDVQSSTRRRRIPTRQHPEIVENLDDLLGDEEPEFADVMTEEDTMMTEPESSTSEEEPENWLRPVRRRPRRQQPERRSVRLRRSNRVIYISHDEASPPRRRLLPSARSQRAARRAAAAGSPAGRRTRSGRAGQILSIAQSGSTEQPTHPPFSHHSSERASGRDMRAYQWLSEACRPVGYYVPQVGDATVFLSELHERFCDQNPFLATKLTMQFAEQLRFAEPCVVTEIRYEIFHGVEPCPTIAHVRLRLMDEERFGKRAFFDIVVPPPYYGHEEFLLNRNLFHKSMEKRWRSGQRVEVFYFGDRCECWKGKIVDDRLEHTQQASVWECERHHRRYLVEWSSAAAGQPEPLSPWDMAFTSLSEGSSATSTRSDDGIPESTRQLLLDALEEAKDRPEAEHFRETLPPQSSFLIQGRTRHDVRKLFYNQVVSLPISLKLIKRRLVCPTYYISLEAFKHDLHLIVQNAHLFTEPTSNVSLQADALEQFILHGLEGASSDSSARPSSDEEFESSGNGRSSMDMRPYPIRSLREAATSPAAYQIRTRGMAKRERQPQTSNAFERTTRRRRYV